MPIKQRAQLPDDTFNNRSAIEKLTGAQERDKATKYPVAEGEAQKSEGERKHKPTSFYLDEGTLRKLDKLAYEYNQHTGQRINRNHIVRFLTAQADLGGLLSANLADDFGLTPKPTESQIS